MEMFWLLSDDGHYQKVEKYLKLMYFAYKLLFVIVN